MMLVSGKKSAAGIIVLMVWIMRYISRICEATKTDGNYTFVYDNEENYCVELNTENLDKHGEDYYVRWSVGKIQEDTEEDSFIPYTGTDETAFWKSEGNISSTLTVPDLQRLIRSWKRVGIL